MKQVSISTEALFNALAAEVKHLWGNEEVNSVTTAYGHTIDVERTVGETYYDLKTGAGSACMDGEPCEIIEQTASGVKLRNVDKGLEFTLSDKEFDIASFAIHESRLAEFGYVLTDAGHQTVAAYIAELAAKRKEILDAGKDTADSTNLPTEEDIVADLNNGVGVDADGDYFNGWGVTDNYEADGPLTLSDGKDSLFVRIEMTEQQWKDLVADHNKKDTLGENQFSGSADVYGAMMVGNLRVEVHHTLDRSDWHPFANCFVLGKDEGYGETPCGIPYSLADADIAVPIDAPTFSEFKQRLEESVVAAIEKNSTLKEAAIGEQLSWD